MIKINPDLGREDYVHIYKDNEFIGICETLESFMDVRLQIAKTSQIGYTFKIRGKGKEYEISPDGCLRMGTDKFDLWKTSLDISCELRNLQLQKEKE